MNQTCLGLLCLALASACGGDTSSAGPDAQSVDATAVDATPLDSAPDAEPDAAVRTFSVVMNRHYETPAGLVTVAKTASEINAEGAPTLRLASDLASEITASTIVDGLITFDNLPVETLWLQYGDTYYVTDQDSIDLSVRLLGRSDKDAAETSPTNLVLNVTDMDAWQEGDQLQLYSAEIGTFGNAMQAYASAGAPAVDDTELVDLTYDLTTSAYNLFLIDGSAGDAATISHLSFTSDGTHEFSALAEVFEPASFTMTDGGSTALTGAFAAVAQDETFTAPWDRLAFDTALRAQVPSETLSRQQLILHTLPGPKSRGAYDSSADLILYSPGYIDDTSKLEPSWSYADPFPADWTSVLTVRYATYRWLTIPDGPSAAIQSNIVVIHDATAVPEGGVVPVAGPATDFKVADVTAYGTLPNVGLTPTLGWSAPSVGQAEVYVVGAVRVFDEDGSVGSEFVASVVTTDTTVTFPAGHLQNGQSYVFFVRTLVRDGIDVLATPFEGAFPNASAIVYSSLATP